MPPRVNLVEHIYLNRHNNDEQHELDEAIEPQIILDPPEYGFDKFINLFGWLCILLIIYCAYEREKFCSMHNYRPEWCKSYLLR